MALPPITDHTDRAVARLVQQYKGKPTFEALVRAAAAGSQELEDTLQEILQDRTLDNAAGAQLDGLGRIAGEPRKGRDDASYRRFIRVRRLLNRASGTAPEILVMFALLLQDGNTAELEEQFPAALVVKVEAHAVTSAEASDYIAILRAAKAGGVRAILEWTPADEADTFSFDGGAGQGFGDASNPATGGKFAGAED